MTVLRRIALDLLSGKLPAIAAEDLTKERLKLCQGCDQLTPMARKCLLCGCFVDLKAKLLDAECPANLW